MGRKRKIKAGVEVDLVIAAVVAVGEARHPREAHREDTQNEAEAETDDPRTMTFTTRTGETLETMRTGAGATRGRGVEAEVRTDTGPALVTMTTIMMTMIKIGAKRTGDGTIFKFIYIC